MNLLNKYYNALDALIDIELRDSPHVEATIKDLHIRISELEKEGALKNNRKKYVVRRLSQPVFMLLFGTIIAIFLSFALAYDYFPLKWWILAAFIPLALFIRYGLWLFRQRLLRAVRIYNSK